MTVLISITIFKSNNIIIFSRLSAYGSFAKTKCMLYGKIGYNHYNYDALEEILMNITLKSCKQRAVQFIEPLTIYWATMSMECSTYGRWIFQMPGR